MNIRTRFFLSVLISCTMVLVMIASVFASNENLNHSPDNNLDFLFAGFAIVWLGIIGYLFYLASHQKSLREEIKELRQMVETSDETQQQ